MALKKHSISDSAIFLWLFPLTYFLHIAEEYWGGEGYPAYLLRVHGVELSATRFLILQCLGLVLMVVGIVIARRLNFPHLLMVMLAAVFLTNASIHVLRSILSAAYEPGLVTSLLVWLPLGTITLFRLRGRMNGGRYFLGSTIGVGICAVVEMITMGKIF